MLHFPGLAYHKTVVCKATHEIWGLYGAGLTTCQPDWFLLDLTIFKMLREPHTFLVMKLGLALCKANALTSVLNL